MRYKNLRLVFLYQAIIGFATIISISTMGGKGIIAICLLALRPFFFERSDTEPEKEIRQLYLDLFKYSIWLTALTIIFIYFSSILLFNSYIKSNIWLLMTIPYFVFISGVIGLLLEFKRRQVK